MSAPDPGAIAAADQERAEYTQILADWIDEARRRAAAGIDPALIVGRITHSLRMATPGRVANLAAVAIWQLAQQRGGEVR